MPVQRRCRDQPQRRQHQSASDPAAASTWQGTQRGLVWVACWEGCSASHLPSPSLWRACRWWVLAVRGDRSSRRGCWMCRGGHPAGGPAPRCSPGPGHKAANQINSLHQIASHKSSAPRRALEAALLPPRGPAMAENGRVPRSCGQAGMFVTGCRSRGEGRADGKSIRGPGATGPGDLLRQDLLLNLPSSSLFLRCPLSPSCFYGEELDLV